MDAVFGDRNLSILTGRDKPKSEGRDLSPVTKLVGAGLPEKIQDVQLKVNFRSTEVCLIISLSQT